jgi:aspartate carbamoyltransferase regulatory subunit
VRGVCPDGFDVFAVRGAIMMMQVTSISEGIVLDHITSGNGLKIFSKLNLAGLDHPVVLLMNVPSQRLGRKDIIKIQNIKDIDLAMIGLVDPSTTVNVISGGKIISKHKVGIPEVVRGLFKCSNPRCVTNSDTYAEPCFRLVDAESREYACEYCEETTRYRF